MVNYCQILPQMTRLLFGAELTEADAERHREFIEECIRRIIEPRTGADQVKRYSNQHDPA